MAIKKLEARRMDIPSVMRKARVTCTGYALYRALPWVNPQLLTDTWKQVRLEANREAGYRASGLREWDQETVYKRLGIRDCLERVELIRIAPDSYKQERVGPVVYVRDLCKRGGTYIVTCKVPHATCVHDGRSYDSYWTEDEAQSKRVAVYYRVLEDKVQEAQANHDEIYMGRIRAAEARKEQVRRERSERMKALYHARQAAKQDQASSIGDAASCISESEYNEATAVALILA